MSAVPDGPLSGRVVLVTRAQPGCCETADALAARGARAIESPAIALETVSGTGPLVTDGLQGIVFTSANGVRAFADRSGWRAGTAWCVGPATLAAAEVAGFPDVRNGDGNAEDLAALIVAEADPAAGRLLHVANTAAAGVLVETLRRAGFDAAFAGLYAPVAARALTAEAQAALGAGDVAAVLFHSAKGAEAFAGAVGDGVRAGLSSVVAVAVSDKALAPAAALGWRGLVVAERPNEASLLAALEGAIGSV